MIRIAAAALFSLAFGALLAWLAFPYAGLAGAVILVGAAFAARAYWSRRHAAGDGPSPHEREAWHAMVGLGVAAGHWTVALGIAIPGPLDLHIGMGNDYAADNWTLLTGALVAFFIVRSSDRTRDERDLAHRAAGNAAGYMTLTILLIGFLLWLAFAPVVLREDLDQFIIANLLIVLIELAAMVKQAVQLRGYALDARAVEG